MSWVLVLKNLKHIPVIYSMGKEIFKAINDASNDKQEVLMKADRIKVAFANKDQEALNEIFRELSR